MFRALLSLDQPEEELVDFSGSLVTLVTLVPDALHFRRHTRRKAKMGAIRRVCAETKTGLRSFEESLVEICR